MRAKWEKQTFIDASRALPIFECVITKSAPKGVPYEVQGILANTAVILELFMCY